MARGTHTEETNKLMKEIELRAMRAIDDQMPKVPQEPVKALSAEELKAQDVQRERERALALDPKTKKTLTDNLQALQQMSDESKTGAKERKTHAPRPHSATPPPSGPKESPTRPRSYSASDATPPKAEFSLMSGLKAAWKGFTEDHSWKRLFKGVVHAVGLAISNDQPDVKAIRAETRPVIEKGERTNSESTSAKQDLAHAEAKLNQDRAELNAAKAPLEKAQAASKKLHEAFHQGHAEAKGTAIPPQEKEGLKALQEAVTKAEAKVKASEKEVQSAAKAIGSLSEEKDNISRAKIAVAMLKSPETSLGGGAHSPTGAFTQGAVAARDKEKTHSAAPAA